MNYLRERALAAQQTGRHVMIDAYERNRKTNVVDGQLKMREIWGCDMIQT